MNPQTPSPQPGGEQVRPVSPETIPAAELVPVPGAVELPQVPPAAANTSSQTPAQLTAQDVAAAIAQMPAGPNVPVASTPPPAAADQDVIEPEWVDQAEAVIERTAGDPFAEEAAVEALQTDYLAKRYGHQVKNPDQTT